VREEVGEISRYSPIVGECRELRNVILTPRAQQEGRESQDRHHPWRMPRTPPEIKRQAL
jgi:hypothetical protein